MIYFGSAKWMAFAKYFFPSFPISFAFSPQFFIHNSKISWMNTFWERKTQKVYSILIFTNFPPHFLRAQKFVIFNFLINYSKSWYNKRALLNFVKQVSMLWFWFHFGTNLKRNAYKTSLTLLYIFFIILHKCSQKKINWFEKARYQFTIYSWIFKII